MAKTHPHQSEAPHRLDTDDEHVEAALEELEHYMNRADTSPLMSNLDPNLRRALDHLEAIKTDGDE